MWPFTHVDHASGWGIHGLFGSALESLLELGKIHIAPIQLGSKYLRLAVT